MGETVLQICETDWIFERTDVLGIMLINNKKMARMREKRGNTTLPRTNPERRVPRHYESIPLILIDWHSH